MGFEVRSLHESEKDECIALWCNVFKFDDNLRYFRRYLYGDIDWNPEYTQVGELDGKIVSAAHVVKRIVACGEYRLTMGGMANVSTLSEHRGNGYNTACLKQVLKVMEADAFDFSTLGTGIPAYYERLGYATLTMPRIKADIPKSLPFPSSYLTRIRPAQTLDMEAIQTLYRTYNTFRSLTVQRTPIYWRDWLEISPLSPPEDVYVAEEERGKIVGYIKAHLDGKEGIGIAELAYADGYEEAAEDMIYQLLDPNSAPEKFNGRNVLSLECALDSAVLRTAEKLLGTREINYEDHSMGRVLHRDNLLRSFLPQWSERLRNAGSPSGILTFHTPYGAVRIIVKDGEVSLSTPEDDQGAFSHGTLLKLLLGVLPANKVSNNLELLPLLEAMFPLQASAYYSADGF